MVPAPCRHASQGEKSDTRALEYLERLFYNVFEIQK